MTNNTDPVRALIADWREEAAECHAESETPAVKRDPRAYAGFASASRILTRCADEAESALAQQPAAPDCPSCRGSGEIEGEEGAGPDVWLVTVNCPNCGGNGEQPAAASAPVGVDLVAELTALRRAYVRLLESARDRILDLGGSCDPVDVMERNDIDLRRADAALRTLSQQPAALTLAKRQPCGCVICTCEDERQCQGCGAKHCGNLTDHPPYVVQQPAAPSGDAVAWLVEREGDPTFPRAFTCESDADGWVRRVELHPFAKKRPLIYGDTAPQQPAAPDFCDGHCTWLDHAPGCPRHEGQQPAAPSGDAVGEYVRATVTALERIGEDQAVVAGVDTSALADKGRSLLAAPQQPAAVDGVALIAAERRRQVESEGWTPEHDDEHDDHQLSQAAACYALGVPTAVGSKGERVTLWPWDGLWWKPGDRIRDLTKAGALIAAEIDRLHRAANRQEVQ